MTININSFGLKHVTNRFVKWAQDWGEAYRIRNQLPHYGLGGVLLLCLLMGVSYLMVRSVHSSLWASSFRDHWYYDSPVSVLLVVCVVLCYRPQLLALSRWRPRWIDVIVGGFLGFLIPAILLFVARDPVHNLHLRSLPASSFLPIVFFAPLLEEIVCRGIFLKSLKSYLPRALAVVMVTLLVAVGHSNFWAVLPTQLMLSIVYVALGDSLPVSVVAHVVNNAVVFAISSGDFGKRWLS